MSWRGWIGRAAAIGLCVGCKSDPAPGPTAAVDAYADRSAHAACDDLEPCCVDNGLAFDKDKCLLGGAGFVALGVAGAKDAGATFDEQQANACVAAMRDLTKRCARPEDEPTLAAPCSAVFSGPKPVGEACTSSLDCTSDAEGPGHCYLYDRAGGVDRAICVIHKRPANVGETCALPFGQKPTARTLADCESSGLWCDFTCKALPNLGEDCSSARRCAKGLRCDGAKCVAAFVEGAACTGDGDCVSRLCNRGKCAKNARGAVLQCSP